MDKFHIICQIFPEIDGHYFGVVYTPKETLVCYSTSISTLKKSLAIAVQEVCDYIDKKTSENDFVKSLQEREEIMRGIMAQHEIPLCNDLYKCLTDFFPTIKEGYCPFACADVDNQTSEFMSIGEVLKFHR